MGDELEVRHLDGLVIRRASVAPASIDAEHRTAEVVWSTGARVLRSPWFGDSFYEELSLTPGHVRLERLTSGRAPVLDAHDGWDTRGVVGVVEAARVADGEGTARVRFARDDERADGVWNKVQQGILRNVSIGYRIHKLEKVEGGEGKIPVMRATDWEPCEISVVPMGADAGAAFRAATFPVHEEPAMEPQKNGSAAAVTDPVPPVPPVVTGRAAPDAGEVRVLGRADSVRSWVEERSKHPKEFGELRLGDCLRALITGPRTELEKRVLSEGTDSAGGFTVPDILAARWIDRLRAALVIVRAGAVTVPLTSDVVKIARLAADPTAAWRSENAAVAESDPTFEAVTFTPRSLDVFTKVSRELLEDSINIGDMLEAALVRSFAVEVDRVCLFGSGTPPQPRGLRTTTNVNEVSQGTNGAALANYDPIVNLMELLWTDNVTAIGAAVMAPRTLSTLGKLKDTTNQPLARPAVLADMPFLQTANVSITETQGTANNASTLFLGDWPMLMLGVRTEMQVEVARELFRGNYQYGFFGHLRMDVQVAHPESFGRLIGIIP